MKITIEFGKSGAERRIRVPRWLPIALIGGAVAVFAYAGMVTLPHSFSAGTPILAEEVNANFDAIVTEINGNIGSGNIADDSIQGGDIAGDTIGIGKLKDNTRFRIPLAVGHVTDPGVGSAASITFKRPTGPWGLVADNNDGTYEFALPSSVPYEQDGSFLVYFLRADGTMVAGADFTDLGSNLQVDLTTQQNFQFVIWEL